VVLIRRMGRGVKAVMNEQICVLCDGFNMYETDPETHEYAFMLSPQFKTNPYEPVVFISSAGGAWDLFLTSRGLFYVARSSVNPPHWEL
jgi:hypothetical protein